MTYRELLEKLQKFTDHDLDSNVTVLINPIPAPKAYDGDMEIHEMVVAEHNDGSLKGMKRYQFFLSNV